MKRFFILMGLVVGAHILMSCTPAPMETDAIRSETCCGDDGDILPPPPPPPPPPGDDGN